jgi:glycosyltransferase involved in cell wall biosynthesis
MRVSIVIPAHNEEDAIGNAIESCLAQIRRPDEIIVVNDGSKDRTRQIVGKICELNPAVKLINYDSGHSAAFARNRGAEKASGDIVVFFDADHVIPKETVSEIMRSFEAGADAVSYRVVTKPESFIQKCFHANQVSFARKFYGLSEKPSAEVAVESPSMPAPFCFRKNVFEDAGRYDEKIFYFEDRVILGKLLAAGRKIIYNPQALVYHQDPRDFGEFMRQVRFIGNGLATYDNTKEKTKIILPGLLWYAIAASLVLSIYHPLLLSIALAFFVAFIYETIVRAYYSRDIVHSVGYMILLSFRGLILTAYYLRSILT